MSKIDNNGIVYNQKYWLAFLYSLFAYFLFDVCWQYVWENNKLFQVFQGLSCLALIFFYIKLKKRLVLKGFALLFYLLYVSICFVTLLRWPFTPMQIPEKFLLLSNSYMWSYFLPLIFLVKIDVEMLSEFFHILLLYCVFAIVFCIVNYRDFYFDSALLFYSMIGFDSYVVVRPQVPLDALFPLTFFVSYFSFWNRKSKLLYIVTFVFALIAALMMGRRSCAAMGIGLLFIALFLNINTKNIIRVVCLVIFLALLFWLANFDFDKALPLDSTFQVLFGRMDQDTRSGTEVDFFRNFSAIDWFVGRGINGTYRSLAVSDIDRLNRFVCETGYLNFILHGGLILLVPYILLLLNSIYKGLFKSSNKISKVCSVYLFYTIILLYPGGFPSLSMSGILLWICIYICQSEKFRHINENNFVKLMKFSTLWK